MRLRLFGQFANFPSSIADGLAYFVGPWAGLIELSVNGAQFSLKPFKQSRGLI